MLAKIIWLLIFRNFILKQESLLILCVPKNSTEHRAQSTEHSGIDNPYGFSMVELFCLGNSEYPILFLFYQIIVWSYQQLLFVCYNKVMLTNWRKLLPLGSLNSQLWKKIFIQSELSINSIQVNNGNEMMMIPSLWLLQIHWPDKKTLIIIKV